MEQIKRIGHRLGLHKIDFAVNLYHKYLKMRYKLPDKDVIIYVDDLKMKIYSPTQSYMARNLFLYGVFEAEVTKLIKENLSNGMVAIDVGSDMGYFTAIMAKKVGINGRIFAFEPISWGYNRTLENLYLNNLKNVIMSKYALFDKSGSTVIISPGKESRVDPEVNRVIDNKNSLHVDLIKFDDYIEGINIDRIDLIKIDCEGAELNILKGMKKTLLKYNPKLIVEVHLDKIKHYGFTKADLLDFLANMDYVYEKISNTLEEEHFYFKILK